MFPSRNIATRSFSAAPHCFSTASLFKSMSTHSFLLQFASRLCRAGPNHFEDNRSISTAAPRRAFPIRLSSWIFLANPPRFLSKLLPCPSRRFHADSDQTLLFPIWSGPVCAMPSLSEQIQFKERLFRSRSLLTSPKHFCSPPVPVRCCSCLFPFLANHCCSGLAVPTLCFSFPLLCFSARFPSKSIPIRIDYRRDHLSRRSIWKYGMNFALCS